MNEIAYFFLGMWTGLALAWIVAVIRADWRERLQPRMVHLTRWQRFRYWLFWQRRFFR